MDIGCGLDSGVDYGDIYGEAKMSLFHKGYTPWMKGKHHSEEAKRKMSLAHKGKKLSENHKQKLSEALRGEKNPMYGKVLSNETKKKISDAEKGKFISDETRKKMSLNNSKFWLGKNITEESKLKNRLAHLGKKHTEEWKEEARKRIPWNKYKKLSENHKQKLSLAKKGKIYGGSFKKGRDHPSWQGGKSFEPYTIEFTKQFRNKIRQRDNQVCMNCGKHREQLKTALSIHHINYDKKLSIPENCIALCKICHSLTNFNREYWTKLFQDKLSHLYGYQYQDGKIKVNLNNYLNEINKENVEENLRKAQEEANRLNEAIKK